MKEIHQLFHTVHQLSRELSKQLNIALEPHGLYSAQWTVLYVLKQKGTLTQSELCDYLAVEAPPMTRMVQRLLKQGYIEQMTGEDKRKKYIRLTAASIQKFPVWEAAVVEANERLVESLDEKTARMVQAALSDWLTFLKEDARNEVGEMQQ